MTGSASAASEPPGRRPVGGGSAFARGEQLQSEIELVTSQIEMLSTLLRNLQTNQDAWRVGGQGEAQVVEVLVAMDQAGWLVMADRRWPGTRANLDALVVGPGGLFIIDVKTWRDARVEGGMLWHGQAPAHDSLGSLDAQARAVGELLTPHGYPASQVTPMLVLAGRALPETTVDAVRVVGERDLNRTLASRGSRLTREQVARLAALLDRECPPMPVDAPAAQHRGRPVRAAPVLAAPEAVESALFSREEVLEAVIAAACAGPIESWMTWLHPTQAELVSRTWNGPARIQGAAGTGKTVVALHRAKYLAERSGGQVLVTSFVRTLPRVHRSLFDRMAPGLRDRVEFISLHQWAMRLLRERGIPAPVDQIAARTAFFRAWSRVGRQSLLGGVPVDPAYWQDEIVRVIKGRDITDVEEYLALKRVGRRLSLQPAQRRAVWDMLLEYEELKSDRGVWDWSDVISAALGCVRDDPEQGYAAVIVDEVQDLSVTGLRLLHSLVGDSRDGLLLVGDGQQSIYAGAFTAAEAGVSITGRSAILRRNYRNGGDILTRALDVVRRTPFGDLSDDLELGTREVDIARPGGQLTEVIAQDQKSLEAALCTFLDELSARHVLPGDIAVLVGSGVDADRWLGVIRSGGHPAIPLADYVGEPVSAVKVGTHHRAKGLEFAHVLIPDLHVTPRPRRSMELEDAFQERAELEQRQLFVAMTRARDGLWLGRIGS